MVFAPVLTKAQVQVWGPDEEVKGLVEENTGMVEKDPREIIANIINVILGFLGLIAVILILIGGFKWMTAGGNEDQVAEAKKWIYSGVVGLLIILASYAIATFVLSQLSSVTT